MHCEQASEMMSARLDGCLDRGDVSLLEEHLAGCRVCQAEWHRLQALDNLLVSAPMMHAPARLQALVSARLSRREQVHRAVIGGAVLALGTATLALLTLAPALLTLLNAGGIAPALIMGGPESVAQLLTLLCVTGRTLLVLAERFAAPLISLGLCSMLIALALNRLWTGAVLRLRAMS